MEPRKKEIVKLLSSTLSNTAVIGFGLAIYENRLIALLAGISALIIAVILTWRAES